MPSTTPCNPGDVVLVRFPFTDWSSDKRRPAVVVSPPGFPAKYGDVAVVALTSRDPGDPTLAVLEWAAAGLLKPTLVQASIATLSSAIIVRRMGRLTSPDVRQLSRVIGILIDPSLPPQEPA